jgi:hypothetical protein
LPGILGGLLGESGFAQYTKLPSDCTAAVANSPVW